MKSAHASLSLVCAFSVAHGARAAEPRDPPGAPAVKLLNAGQQPRRVLRYALARPVSQRVSMEMTMGMQLKPGTGGETKMPVIPATRVTFDMEVSPDPSGRLFSYKYRVASAELLGDPQRSPVVDAFEKQFTKIVGSSGAMTMTSRGIIIESEVNMVKEVAPDAATFRQSFEQSMRQLSALLPVEPVGRGAVWEISSKVSSSGIIVNQTSRYTLTSMDGAHIAANVQMKQSAGSQTIHLPSMPSGREVHLDSVDGKGQGSIDIDLSRMIATGAFQNATEVRKGEKEKSTSMTMTVDVTLALAR